MPCQRISRAAGNLPSGTALIVRYFADRVIEDAVSSGRPVHLTEQAEFETAAGGANRARAALQHPRAARAGDPRRDADRLRPAHR